MNDFLFKIKTEYKTEYNFISGRNSKNIFESQVKLYSKPRIYCGGKNFDLSKRWYVYFFKMRFCKHFYQKGS